MIGPLLGVDAFWVGFVAVWYIWALAFAGVILVVGAMIGRWYVEATETKFFQTAKRPHD